jgi:uncharacterized protein YidB (DUF937 family)
MTTGPSPDTGIDGAILDRMTDTLIILQAKCASSGRGKVIAALQAIRRQYPDGAQVLLVEGDSDARLVREWLAAIERTSLGTPGARRVRVGATAGRVADILARHRERDAPSVRLWDVADDDAVCTLADRAAAQASLDKPGGVAELLRTLYKAGADDAVRTLADRAAAQASPDDPGGVAELLRALCEAGADDAVRTLADRAAAQASPDDPGGVAELLRALCEAGADDAVRTLAARAAARAAAQACLNWPQGLAELWRALCDPGPDDSVRALLGRDPAAQPSLDDPGAVAELLRALCEAGADDAVRTLADRAANAGMFDPFLEAKPDGPPITCSASQSQIGLHRNLGDGNNRTN